MAKKIFKQKPKEVEVIDMAGAKTVKRKTSWVKRVNIIATIISIFWLAFVVWAPLHVKNKYSEPIKKSIIVSMFFDLQRNLEEQYRNLLKSIANAVDLQKPIAYAIDKVKMVEKPLAEAERVSQQAHDVSGAAKQLSGIAGRFGVNTGTVDKTVGQADKAISKADSVTKLVNEKLDKAKEELQRVANTELDKEIDKQVKILLDKHTGLGTTLLTNYGIKHVYPWRPSTWPVTTKIYNDLERSSLSIIRSLTDTVNLYFGYVAWGLVFAAWAAGLLIWMSILGKVRSLTKPFLVCPRCGHTYADARTGFMLLKVFQPWKWFM